MKFDLMLMAGARALTFGGYSAVGTEAMPATAIAGRIRVFDHAKTAAHHCLEVIDQRTLNKWQTGTVHHKSHPIGFKHRISLERAVVDSHAVTVTAATTRFDKNPYGSVFFTVFTHDLERLLSTRVGNPNVIVGFWLFHYGCHGVNLALLRQAKGAIEYLRSSLNSASKCLKVKALSAHSSAG